MQPSTNQVLAHHLISDSAPHVSDAQLIQLPATYLILSSSTPSPSDELDLLSGASLAKGSVDMESHTSPLLLGQDMFPAGNLAQSSGEDIEVIRGGVIMPGLGNETAKLVQAAFS